MKNSKYISIISILVVILIVGALGFGLGSSITGKVTASESLSQNKLLLQQVEELSKDAGEIKQLKDFLGTVEEQPFATPLPEHLYKALEDKDGNVIAATFLHFDKPVGQDSNILFVGDAVPGKFCDSTEVQDLIKNGYVHFHTTNKVATPDEGHGGKGGEPGFWLRHISLAKGEIEYNFMPTPPPKCQ